MRRLSLIALIVLTASLFALPALATDDLCPSGWQPWSFHSGQTPYTYNCNSTNANLAPAYDYAEIQCADAWASAQNLVNHNGFYGINMSDGQVPNTWPTTYRWYFSCYTCIQGYPPAWADHLERLAPIGMTEAVNTAKSLVNGVVVDAQLEEIGEEGEDSLYYINIVEDDVMRQVTVDATTGEAILQKGIEPASCPKR